MQDVHRPATRIIRAALLASLAAAQTPPAAPTAKPAAATKTPESDVPTMPNATKNHGADLLAWKKLWLLALREVRSEMTNSTAK